ncbi:hypothetical protein AK812_SmicGene2654 [Symbiodinium microadriaticum]|uniref:BART domain-containing protein n=1 Tax=Symbiodinium microadriaticum TaxID=2951 RepID=A0A1Q9F0X3_SYMMI|nr:hypothetical protein AK812_SmicGene2654 [Symbiodinium microadriaticum]
MTAELTQDILILDVAQRLKPGILMAEEELYHGPAQVPTLPFCITFSLSGTRPFLHALNMAKPSRELLQGLREYMEEEDFLLEISCWAWEYCMKFPQEAPSQWEHPLEFTTLHSEYREIFEGRAAEFCEQEGLDLQELLEGVAASLRDDPGETRALIDSLTASEDYLSFCRFMQQVRQRRDWAEGRDVVPLPDLEDVLLGGADENSPPKASLGRGLPKVVEEETLDNME